MLADPQVGLSFGTQVFKRRIYQPFHIGRFHVKNPDIQYLMEKALLPPH